MWLTVDDFLDDWISPEPPAVPENTIERWIGKAERFLLREFPNLEERLASGAEPKLAETVADVVSSIVTRVLRNPDGMRSIQKTSGPYSESVTFGGDTPGALFLTDEERAALAEPGASRSGQAFGITIGGDTPFNGHLPWCHYTWDTHRCSCGVDIAGVPIYEMR